MRLNYYYNLLSHQLNKQHQSLCSGKQQVRESKFRFLLLNKYTQSIDLQVTIIFQPNTHSVSFLFSLFHSCSFVWWLLFSLIISRNKWVACTFLHRKKRQQVQLFGQQTTRKSIQRTKQTRKANHTNNNTQTHAHK